MENYCPVHKDTLKKCTRIQKLNLLSLLSVSFTNKLPQLFLQSVGQENPGENEKHEREIPKLEVKKKIKK